MGCVVGIESGAISIVYRLVDIVVDTAKDSKHYFF